MKKFTGKKGTIILLFLVVLVVGYYTYLSNKDVTKKEGPSGIIPVQEVLLRNLEEDYPPSPKEVVKYYSEITKCFYNEEYTEEELEALAFKIRELYDTELIENQTEEKYLDNLKFDIEDFKDKKFTISSFNTSASTDVDYFTADGDEFAKLNCTFSLRQGTNIQQTKEKFLLRKDEDGHWKIYGWDLAETDKDE